MANFDDLRMAQDLLNKAKRQMFRDSMLRVLINERVQAGESPLPADVEMAMFGDQPLPEEVIAAGEQELRPVPGDEFEGAPGLLDSSRGHKKTIVWDNSKSGSSVFDLERKQ